MSSMNVFVSDKPFDLSLNLKATYDPNGVLLAIDVLSDSVALTKEMFVLKCKCRGRDGMTMSSIMESATIINHITGDPLVRVSVLYKAIISSFFVEWNLCGEDGMPMPIDGQSVNKLHDAVLKALARKWIRMTGSTKYV